jgi:hypothetical protein
LFQILHDARPLLVADSIASFNEQKRRRCGGVRALSLTNCGESWQWAGWAVGRLACCGSLKSEIGDAPGIHCGGCNRRAGAMLFSVREIGTAT